MSEKPNVQLVKDAYAAFQRGDIAAVLSACTPDIEWSTPGTEEIPFAGTQRGTDGVAEFFQKLAEAEEVQQFEPRDFIAGEDRLVVFGHYRGQVRATGGVVDEDWVHVFTFRDGKVASFREFYDSARAAQAYRTKVTA